MFKLWNGSFALLVTVALMTLQAVAQEPEQRWSGDLKLSGSFTRQAQVVSRSGGDIRVDLGKMFDPRNTSSRQKTIRISIIQSVNELFLDLGGGCVGELVPSPEIRPPRSSKGLDSYTIDFATTGAPVRCAQDSRRAGLTRLIFAARKENAWQLSFEERWEAEGNRPGSGSLKGQGLLRPIRSVNDDAAQSFRPRLANSGMPTRQLEQEPVRSNPLSTAAPARLATGPNQGRPASVPRMIEFDAMMSLLNGACEDPAAMKLRITRIVNAELGSNQQSLAQESWRAFDLLNYSKLGDLCKVRTALAQCDPLPDDAKARCDCTAGIVGKSKVGPGVPKFLLKANAFIAWDACDRARASESDQTEHNRYELQMARAGNFLQTGFRSTVAKKSETQFSIDAKIELAWIQLDELYSGMAAAFPPLTRDRFYAQVNRTIAAIKTFESSDPAEAATIYAQLGALIRTGESTARMTRAAGSILFPPPSSIDRDLEAMVRIDAHNDFLRHQSMIRANR